MTQESIFGLNDVPTSKEMAIVFEKITFSSKFPISYSNHIRLSSSSIQFSSILFEIGLSGLSEDQQCKTYMSAWRPSLNYVCILIRDLSLWVILVICTRNIWPHVLIHLDRANMNPPKDVNVAH